MNWKSLTYRWGGKRTKTYIQNLRPQPTVRWKLDKERAERIQQKFERALDDTPVTEAWQEFLQELMKLGLLK